MAGAETMAHRMAKFLVSKGHDVTVLCPFEDKEIDGVRVRKHGSDADQYFKECDLVFTHLNATSDTFNRARAARKKIIHIAHNSFEYLMVKIRVPNNFIVYNSQWVKDALSYPQDSIVLNPPVDYREYSGVKTDKAKYITLINHNENKGGQVLIDIAKQLPDLQFMAVEGGYYDQIKDESVKNIKYVPQNSDIKKILKDTRILLVPSDYESWGQVAVEAAACGIPVIASPTEGLKSSMQGAAYYADRNKIHDWVFMIESLQDKKRYDTMSKKAKQRAIELDPLPQLEAFNTWLEQVNKQPYL